MRLLVVAILLAAVLHPTRAQQAPPPAKAAAPAPSPRGLALKEFAARFRQAVLGKDVGWILANMDRAGWSCGDAEMPAADYAEAFRAGHMDYGLLFGPPRAPTPPGAGLTYQEWFARCPEAATVETPQQADPGEEARYAVRWQGPGCPEAAPGFILTIRGARLGIKVFSGCM